MKILMSGSGSGGHIYPCIALYNNLKKDHQIIMLIFKQIDKKIYDSNNIKYEFIDDNISLINKLKKINDIYKKNHIYKTITFGGKNSFYINIISKFHNIDSYIFEQNAVIGKANKYNLLLAKYIFTNYKLNLKKECNVGNPNSFEMKKKKINLFNNNKLTILFTMGSLGSSSVNKQIISFINDNKNYNIIYVSGNNVKSNLKENESLKIFEFYNNLSELIYNVDLVVSRAGASTISEIIACNKPSILIPSPYVSNNHQYKNAKTLNDKNCCYMILESELNYATLKSKINNLLLNKDNYNKMKINLAKIYLGNNFKKVRKMIFNDNTSKH